MTTGPLGIKIEGPIGSNLTGTYLGDFWGDFRYSKVIWKLMDPRCAMTWSCSFEGPWGIKRAKGSESFLEHIWAIVRPTFTIWKAIWIKALEPQLQIVLIIDYTLRAPGDLKRAHRVPSLFKIYVGDHWAHFQDSNAISNSWILFIWFMLACHLLHVRMYLADPWGSFSGFEIHLKTIRP